LLDCPRILKFAANFTRMKAAVLHRFGDAPRFEEFPDPIANTDDLLVMHVKAASIKNLDKLRASGTHYASYTHLPAVVGVDAAGLLEDGRRIYAIGYSGTIAEKALIRRQQYTLLPDNIDFATAAALPNAVIGATMAIKFRAAMQPGETVLINGATGVTGQLAVQVARHYGAGHIIATGRNKESLKKVKELGAHTTIELTGDDEAIIQQIKDIHAATPIDIVIDYLWGHPVSLIIKAFKGGGVHNFTSRVRIVTVGSMAGDSIELSSATLRSSAIEILGSGIGSLSQKEMGLFNTEVLPEMFALAAAGKLTIETEIMPATGIADAWRHDVAPGKRLVVTL